VPNCIIGTAGHVDHGKTELVKALTGRDTDRLVEEKQRGISIVLGFAPLDLGDDVVASVVDVPGHERFVKNMVSGATGVDLALLAVAADEGVMPQTAEHLEVLRLLGVERGVVAITKIDVVDAEMVELVESELHDLLNGTPLQDAPFVHTSIVTGEGIDDLRNALKGEIGKVRGREVGDFFRMPVDRVFTRSGIGTIVTGTTWGGEVRKGDELVIEPSGRTVRVREVQRFDTVLDRATPGIRTALALHGVRVGDVSIGDQILTPRVLETSRMMNAFVEIGTLPGSRLTNRQRVRFHHAAGEILSRVILLGSEKLGDGETGYIQLRLETPTVARRGDRFVLRSYSPMRVIAGGRILDPTAVKAKRFKERTLAELNTLDGGSARDAALALASRSGAAGILTGELRRFGMTEAEATAVCAELEREGLVFTVGGRVIGDDVLEAAERRLIDTVERFAARDRLRWGIDREELKEKMNLGGGPLFDFLLEKGRREGTLFFKSGQVKAGSGDRDLSDADNEVLSRLERRILDAGFAFVTLAGFRDIVGDERRLVMYLRIIEEDGSIVKVSKDGYIHGEVHEEMLRLIGERISGCGSISVGDFKDMCGLSRKYAVPLLEYLDSEGYTVRAGDVRKAGPRFAEGHDD
jgi:selenocysteine-specific elongation factor